MNIQGLKKITNSIIALLSIIQFPVFSQDTAPYEDTSTVVFKRNEIGLGGLLAIPQGFYANHLEKAYGGISISYFRHLHTNKRLNHYLGARLYWVELQTLKGRLSVVEPNGELYSFTSWADSERISLSVNYRLQPDVPFWLWPYLELGAGGSVFYSSQREQFPVEGDDDEFTYDLISTDWAFQVNFGIGIQYFIPRWGAFVDLAWHFSRHGNVGYNIIEDTNLENNQPPIEKFERRKSKANSQIITLTFNYLF